MVSLLREYVDKVISHFTGGHKTSLLVSHLFGGSELSMVWVGEKGSGVNPIGISSEFPN